MAGLIKLVVFALVAYAVWYVYNMAKRLRAAEKALNVERGGHKGTPSVQDLKACPVCGQFVPENGAHACGRPDCPYGR